VSPHTAVTVPTAAHSSVSTHSSYCPYSCKNLCLHTQQLLSILLHTLVSPHTAVIVPTAAHNSVSTQQLPSLQLHRVVSPHTSVTVPTAVHIVVSISSSPYSCKQFCLYTQQLLFLQLHTVGSPHTVVNVSRASKIIVSTERKFFEHNCTKIMSSHSALTLPKPAQNAVSTHSRNCSQNRTNYCFHTQQQMSP